MNQEKKEEEIVIDLSPLQAKLDQLSKEIVEIKEKMLKTNEPKGKGVVEAGDAEKTRLTKVVESLKGRGSLREQWSTPFNMPEPPTAAILSFIQQTDVIEGKMGDVVNIPYVKRFDADILTSVGATLTPKTGIYDVTTTTLKEAAFTTSIPYHDVEKLSEQLIARIEEQGHAAVVRAIDGNIVSVVASTTGVKTLAKGGASVNFDVDWIHEAIAQTDSPSVEPGEFMLVLTPAQYVDFLKDVVNTLSFTYVRPDVTRKGVILEFMGVTVKILPKTLLPNHGTSPTKKCALLIHRDSVVFAPKREMLFETERDTQNRRVKLTASYTFGLAVVDPAMCVVIQTPETA